MQLTKIEHIRLIEKRYESANTIVFLGFDEKKKLPRFVKLLKPHLQHQQEMVQRFQKEAAACATLDHPNIIKLVSFGEIEEYHYLVLEWVDGQNLQTFLQANSDLPTNVILYLTKQILEGLQYAHEKGIVHRDIKPANILLNRNGEIKITDFGLARITGDTALTQQNAMVGTPAYMSPEQITGETLDQRSDLFSIGSVIYEMFSGNQAFGGENFSVCLHKILNESPPEIAKDDAKIELMNIFINRLLEKFPESRFADATEAITNLPKTTSSEAESAIEFLKTYFKNVPNNIPEQLAKSSAGKRTKILKLSAVACFVILFVGILQQEMFSTQNAIEAKKNIELMANNAFVNTKNSDGSEQSAGELPIAKKVDSLKVNPMEFEKTSIPTKNEGVFSQKDVFEENLSNESTSYISDIRNNEIEIPVLKTGDLTINVKPWAKVIIDDVPVDTKATFLNVSLPIGEHFVTLEHPHFPAHLQKIMIKPNQTSEISWQFMDYAGFLNIEARPWAEIFVNGRLMDTSPLKKPLVLPIGDHTIELRNPHLQTIRETITITQGDTLTLQRVLSK